MTAQPAPVTAPTNPTFSAVFARLLERIVAGAYGAGVRLPPERDLAQELGASRATLREALRRLAEWRLVEPRRGSGVVVCAPRDWSFSALPAFLAAAGSTPARLQLLVSQLMTIRRELIIDLLRVVAPRLARADLGSARAAAAAAWALRDARAAFVAADFDVIRALLEAADLLPAVWLLNDVGDVYLDLAARFAAATTTPTDYLDTHNALFDALARGNAARAARIMRDYLERTDRDLLDGGSAPPRTRRRSKR